MLSVSNGTVCGSTLVASLVTPTSKVISEDIRERAAQLTDARARQLALRVEADAARNKGDRRRLLREARGLDAAKRALKVDARSAYGVKLSKHSPQMEKY